MKSATWRIWSWYSCGMAEYLGKITATRAPACLSARGRDPATSARPPVLTNGTASDVAKSTLIFLRLALVGMMGLFRSSRGACP